MGAIELALVAVGAACLPVDTAATRSPLWSGADHMLLTCSADAAATAALGPGWCAIVHQEARRGARIPIRDAAGVEPDRSALTLTVAVRDGEIALTSARALSIDDAEGAFFRRGPALPPGLATDPRVRAAFATAFDGALPWRGATTPPGLRTQRPVISIDGPARAY